MEEQYAIQACLRYGALGRDHVSNVPFLKLPFGYAFWRLVTISPDISDGVTVIEVLHTQLINNRTANLVNAAADVEPDKLYKRWQVCSIPVTENAQHKVTFKPDHVLTIDLFGQENPKIIWRQMKGQLSTLTSKIQDEPSMLFGLLRWDIMIHNAVFRALGELMFSEMPEITWPGEMIYQPGLDHVLATDRNFTLT